MPKISELIIAISADGAQATIGELNKVNQAQTNLAQGAKNVSNASQSSFGDSGSALVEFGREWQSTVGLITTVGIPLMATIGGVKKAIEFSREGAEMQRLRNTSTDLARSMGLDMGDILVSLRESSKGMVSEYDLMQSASRAMMLNVGGSAEQMGQLLEVAALRGRAMGLSTTQSFNDIVTGIGRASPQILDNLGIVIDAESSYASYAASIGKSANELTKFEKTQALLNATLESTGPLLAETGGLVRDYAGNWEYASAQIKTYIDNLKEAIALDREGSSAMGYAEAVGRVFERQNIDKINKGLLELAVNIGLISESEKKWINMPIISTVDSRAQWVEELKPALDEYKRLVNDSGLSAEKAAEKVKYLYDTYGMAAFIDNTDAWVRLNDQLDGASLNFGSLTSMVEGYAITTKTQLPKAAQVAQMAIGDLVEKLAEANLNLDIAITTFYKSVGDDLVSGLRNAGLEGDELVKRLTILDELMGTDYVLEYQLEVETDDLLDTLINDPDGFKSKFETFSDTFAPLISSVAEAQGEVDVLQEKLDDLAREYDVTVNFTTTGSVPTVPSSGGYGPGPRPLPKALGGPVYPNQTYLVGEQGAELFVPSVAGEILPHRETTASQPIIIQQTIYVDKPYDYRKIALEVAKEMSR